MSITCPTPLSGAAVPAAADDPSVDGPWEYGDFTVVCSRSPRPDLMDSFWPVYEESFGPLRVLAAARQVLTQDEFAMELEDPRVWKYVALDAEGRLAGLTTIANDVSTMPWISPEYYQYHYPDECSRGALFYSGIALVRPDMRRYPVFARMVTCVAHRVAASNGLLAFDVCGYNDQERSFSRASDKILNRVAGFHVEAIDVQTYYVARAAHEVPDQGRCREDS